MQRRIIISIAAITSLALVANVVAQQKEKNAKASPAAAALERLKQLAGDWVAVGEDGKPTEKVVLRFRVTAGGTAVNEVSFPGEETEMVTLFHLDGDDLVLTHYCMLGNQPRMKAERITSPNEISFKCTGGSNMKSEADKHMHEATYQFADADHFQTQWSLFENNENIGAHPFNLVRKQ